MSGCKVVRWVVAVAAAVVCFAAPAHAGTYSVWSCRGPAGEPVSAGAWSFGAVDAGAGDVTFADSCASGGAVRVELADDRGFSRPVIGMAGFSAPAGTRIASYELWRSLAVAGPELRLFDFGAAVVTTRDGATASSGCSTWGDACPAAGEPLAAANRVAGSGPADAIRLQVSCRQSLCQEPRGGVAARASLYRARVVLSDDSAPAAPDVVASPAAVTVSSTDAGAGIAAFSLAVDGGEAQVRTVGGAGCREPYTAAQPCPGSAAESFVLDGLAPGEHTVAGTVADAAGNVTAWGPVAFTVAAPPVLSVPPSVPSAPPCAGAACAVVPAEAGPGVLRVSAPRSARAPGKALRLSGTLRTAAGAPIAGAALTVTGLDLGVNRARSRVLARPRTDAQGRFTATVRRDGAVRLTVAYGGASTTLTTRTRVALTARPARGRLVKGRTLTLSGVLRGAAAAAKGAPVRIESIVNGRWTTVGAVKTRAGGRYQWRYRFVHLTRNTTFSFRAVVDSAPAWPWARVRSRAVRVDVDVT